MTAFEELRYRCEQCGKRFKEQRYVTQHMALHKEPHLTCLSCGRRFRWVTSLRNHRIGCYRRMRAEQAAATTRPLADATATSWLPVGLRVDPSAATTTRPASDVTSADLLCRHCGVRFMNLRLLVVHRVECRGAGNSGEPTGQYPCRVCGKSFRKWRYLRQHSEMHSEAKYACDTCGRRFRWATYIKMHRKICSKKLAAAKQAGYRGQTDG
ncbi:hypothetical protein LSAT2_020291 [Lamellibrachia satsuma]|nr:hypothetical protein LSAT2_020291 [Lamellibrachia satsuma]